MHSKREAKYAEKKNSQNGMNLLFQFIKVNELDHLQLLIDNALPDIEFRNMDYRNDENHTPMMCAALNKRINPEIIKKLIPFSLMDEKNNQGQTPIEMAIEVDNFTFIKTCMENNCFEQDINSLLIYFSYKSSAQYLSKLLKARSVDVNFKNTLGDTAIILAAFNGHLDTVKLLIANKANVNVLNHKEYSPLHLAAHRGYLDVTNELLTAKADMTLGKDRKKSILSHVNDFDVTLSLLKAKAEIIDSSYEKLLSEAAIHDNRERIQKLLDAGHSVESTQEHVKKYLQDVKNRVLEKTIQTDVIDGRTLWLRMRSKKETVLLLLENKAVISERIAAPFGRLLISAVKNDDQQMVKLLINQRVNVNYQEYVRSIYPLDFGYWQEVHYGKGSALYFAAMKGNNELVKLLLNSGANVNIDGPKMYWLENPRREYPIDVAKYISTACLLLKAGASSFKKYDLDLIISCENNFLDCVKIFLDTGTQPSDMATLVAIEKNHMDALKLLVDARANLDNAITLATEKENINAIKLLLTKNANPNKTAIFTAAQKGNIDIIQLLLEAKADAHITNEHGKTPIDLAQENQHFEVKKLLQYSRMPSWFQGIAKTKDDPTRSPEKNKKSCFDSFFKRKQNEPPTPVDKTSNQLLAP